MHKGCPIRLSHPRHVSSPHPQEHLQQTEAVLLEAEFPLPPGIARSFLLFRGLRVRCGMASGTLVEHIARNTTSGRVTYSGPLQAAAQACVDAAQGGMVLLQASTFGRVRGCHCMGRSQYLVGTG
jgi:hypothetical protein